MWLSAIFAYALVRGPLSIWLQSRFDCAAEFRVLDVLVFQIGIFGWLAQSSISSGQIKKHLLTLLKIILPLMLIAVLSSAFNDQSISESVSLFGFEFGWVILAVTAVVVRPTITQTSLRGRMIITGAAVGGITALAYSLSIADDIDAAVGYGQCGTTEALLVGGDSGWLRLRGLARNPNETGALMLIPLALAASNLRLKASWWWVMCLVISVAIVLSFSRSALLGAGLIGGFAGWQLTRQRLGRNITISLFAVTTLAMAGLTVLALNSRLGQELILHQDDDSGSTSIRVDALETAADKIQDSPLIGSGLGTAGAAGRALDIKGNFESESYPINVIIELGILGLAALAWALAFILRSLNNTGRIALMALLLANLVAPTIINPPVGLALVILVLATMNKKKRQYGII